MSLEETTQAVSLGKVVAAAAGKVPFLKSALEGVFVRHVSMSLVEEAGKWSFGDWSADVWLPRLEMVTGVVIMAVEITLRDFSSIEVLASAVIMLGDPPIVICLDVKTQDIDGRNGKPTSHEKVYIGAYVLGGDLLATVEYVSAVNWLRAALEPVQRVTVGRILQACLLDSLPSLAVLKRVVDDLQLKGPSIEFLRSGGLDIRHFDFHVADETAVEVQRLVLREVKVAYNVAVTEGDWDDKCVGGDGSLADGSPNAANGDVSTTSIGDTNKQVGKRHTGKHVKTLDMLVIINQRPVEANIAICSVKKPDVDGKTLAFSIEPVTKDGLTLRGLLSLIEWKETDVNFTEPGLHPSPLDVAVDMIKGQLTARGLGQG
ncbi:hypothetical protein JMJ35_004558 [Cladonia borealis]|uniref:Uncharacterized protein n=1 Tax=Cladonia borealis TaxID=184061 RepID=A0AA39R333_9LECA|nr:hypothetical protein JMJ35_004558 [Cladonia borealis]